MVFDIKQINLISFVYYIIIHMQGTIYKLYATTDKYYYYGSTTMPIHKRYIRHLSAGFSDKLKYGNCKLYSYMKTTNINDWVLEEVEICNIENLNEREAYYVNAHLSDPYCLNTNAIHLRTYNKAQLKLIEKYTTSKLISQVLKEKHFKLPNKLTEIEQHNKPTMQDAINYIFNINPTDKTIESADNHLPSADTLPTSLSANSQPIPSATSSATRR